MRLQRLAAGALAAALAAPAAAQDNVNVRQTTPATGSLEVHLISGEVRLVPWGRGEVAVTGQIGADHGRVEASSSGDRVVVRVHPLRGSPSRRGSSGARLEVRYPSRKALQIHTMSADVDVQGASAATQVNTVSGDVRVSGEPTQLVVNTRSGDVLLAGSTGRLTASSISGNVVVEGGVRAEAEVRTVSGDIQLGGPVGTLRAQSVSGDIQAERVGTAAEVQTVSGDVRIVAQTLVGEYNTVSGDITLAGSPGAGRTLEVHSHSGLVELRLPRGTDADLEITTWSGEISIDVDGARMTSSSRRERQVRLGRGGPRVELSTFSGTVRVTGR